MSEVIGLGTVSRLTCPELQNVTTEVVVFITGRAMSTRIRMPYRLLEAKMYYYCVGSRLSQYGILCLYFRYQSKVQSCPPKSGTQFSGIL